LLLRSAEVKPLFYRFVHYRLVFELFFGDLLLEGRSNLSVSRIHLQSRCWGKMSLPSLPRPTRPCRGTEFNSLVCKRWLWGVHMTSHSAPASALCLTPHLNSCCQSANVRVY